MNNKKVVIIASLILLAWFFLDMIGITFGKHILVTQSYRDDGIFLLILVISLTLFCKWEKVGKYILLIWLSLWFVTQMYSHWLFTIFGPWEGKNQYFSNTIKLISSDTVYIPDLYHIILHVFILTSLIFTIMYFASLRKNKKQNT